MKSDKPRRRVRLLVPRPPVATTRHHAEGVGAPFDGVQGHAGGEQLWAYGYLDVAHLKGVEPGSVRRAVLRGQVMMGDLLSVARYVYSRSICRCCERPILPPPGSPPEPEELQSFEPSGPPRPQPTPPTETERYCMMCWDDAADRLTCLRPGCACACHAPKK